MQGSAKYNHPRHLKKCNIIFLGGIIIALQMVMTSPCHANEVAANNQTATSSQKTPIKVSYINPGAPGNPFWDRTTQFMQAAAKSLNIDLNIIYGNDNRLKTTQAVLAAMSESNADYFLYIYQIGQGLEILKQAEKLKAKSIIFNTSIPENDKPKVGKPGEIFTYWQAHFIPDDISAGEMLAKYLIMKYRQSNQNLAVEMVAINGNMDSTAAIDRQTGLNRFLNDQKNVKLNQLTWAKWSEDLAALQTQRLLIRYPHTCVIWSASDGMATGAAHAASAASRAECKKAFIGGIDWSEEGIEAVRNGTLDASVGGHFMEGAWALVLIYDLAHNIKLSAKNCRVLSPMALLNQENINKSSAVLKPENWSHIDFKKFSIQHSTSPDYHFSIESINSQLDQP